MSGRLPRAAVIAVSIGVLTIGAAVLLVPSSPGNAAARADGVLGPGVVTVQLDVHHSHFTPSFVRVRPHTEVRFEVVNRDPIGHELIVGDAAVHARHELGTEPTHPPRPGEVSVAAHSRASTTYVFHEPGTVVYACHLPGHFAYGMHGRVVVTPA
ncbi:MAG: plastocyanin/azurin family copper-binding protein [Acidimicrobiia bacterium]